MEGVGGLGWGYKNKTIIKSAMSLRLQEISGKFYS